jgi:MFS family permease
MRSKPVILAALLLGAFLVNLATTLVNGALPALVRGLHATTTQLQCVVDSCSLVFAALLLTFGNLSDRFGRKGMLLAGLAVVGGASRAQLIAAQPAHHNVLHDAATAQGDGEVTEGPESWALKCALSTPTHITYARM